MRDITFGITTFERPALLINLVRSIQQRYPMAEIVVADNGKQRARLPDTVTHLRLPFDSGLSRARNALVDQLKTKYLLVLEDDFLFTQETEIEPLLEVLEADDSVGVVGGALRTVHGRVAAYALDIEVFRDTMYVREATHRLYFTPRGLPYRLCDMVWNFALFRKEMLRDHRWIDRLKVGEHCPYFHQVKLAGRWRVAACAATRIYHVPEQRSPGYLKYRRRAQEMFEGYLAEHNIKNYHRVLPYHFEDDEHNKPSVVVLGVGHSGTSVLSKMLMHLGWNGCDADEEFGESVSVRKLNQLLETTGKLPLARAIGLLESMPRPWVIKDPRFVQTLHHWMPLFQTMEQKPVLLRIRRDREDMLDSYARRGSPGEVPYRVTRQLQECQEQYDRWPWMRLTIDYELLARAVGQFDLKRATGTERFDKPNRQIVSSMPEVDSCNMSPVAAKFLQWLSLTRDSAVAVQTLEAYVTQFSLETDSANDPKQLFELLSLASVGSDSNFGKEPLLTALQYLGIKSDSGFYGLMQSLATKAFHDGSGQHDNPRE